MTTTIMITMMMTRTEDYDSEVGGGEYDVVDAEHNK